MGLTLGPTAAMVRTAEAQAFCGQRSAVGARQCRVGILSQLASQAAVAQEESSWCWAACISMVFDYFGRPVSQARIVEQTFGTTINLPANSDQILGQINRVWTDDHGVRFLAEGGSLPVLPPSFAAYLARDKPLIVGTLGHAMVMTEYRWVEDVFGQHHPAAAVVRDPALGGRERVLTLTEARMADFLAFVNVVG